MSQTLGGYHRRLLEKWLADQLIAQAEQSMENPVDGAEHWMRVGRYHAIKEVLAKMEDLDHNEG